MTWFVNNCYYALVTVKNFFAVKTNLLIVKKNFVPLMKMNECMYEWNTG